MSRASSARVVGRFIIVISHLALLSAVIIGPWTVGLWHGSDAVNFEDVFRTNAVTALALWIGLRATAALVLRSPSRLLPRLAIVLAMSCAFLVADRIVLARFGLPIWIHDTEAHFKNRPNAVRRGTDGRANPVTWRVNSHGYHDDEFPEQKPAGELRGLMLGDSLTQGFNLEYKRTYSHALETLLDERDSLNSTHQIMNAGVAGYSVFQETIAARDGLRFQPDFVSVGFCMNDATELFRVQKEFGGSGVDYHKVIETGSELAGFLLNETGTGRLLQYLKRDRSSIDARKRWEDFNVRDMAQNMDKPRYQTAWSTVLGQLDELYRLVDEAKIPVVLVIFPYSFQLADVAWQEPQRLLIEHAASRGVPVVDLTPVFGELIYDDADVVAEMRAGGADSMAIHQAHLRKGAEYFFDSNHLTPEGSRVAAHGIFDYLVEAGIASTSR